MSPNSVICESSNSMSKKFQSRMGETVRDHLTIPRCYESEKLLRTNLQHKYSLNQDQNISNTLCVANLITDTKLPLEKLVCSSEFGIQSNLSSVNGVPNGASYASNIFLRNLNNECLKEDFNWVPNFFPGSALVQKMARDNQTNNNHWKRKNCDECVKKKIKCNGDQPCSMCTRKFRTCSYSVKQKPGPKSKPLKHLFTNPKCVKKTHEYHLNCRDIPHVRFDDQIVSNFEKEKIREDREQISLLPIRKLSLLDEICMPNLIMAPARNKMENFAAVEVMHALLELKHRV